MNSVKNKTVVLTGATGGIGCHIAAALANQGAQLILVGRDEEKLTALISAIGGHHQYLIADLSNKTGLESFAAFCKKQPRIDVLINNAGINDFIFFEKQKPERIEQIIRLNLLVPMFTIRVLLPKLQQQSEAVILNVGSTLGSIGYPGNASYCASKFGLRGFTEALRRELFNSTVKVHYLSPRATRTSMNSKAVDDMNKALGNGVDEPQVVVAAVMKLLKAKKSSDAFIGWPEKLFVRINGVFPKLVTQTIAKQLDTIRHFAFRSQHSRGG